MFGLTVLAVHLVVSLELLRLEVELDQFGQIYFFILTGDVENQVEYLLFLLFGFVAVQTSDLLVQLLQQQFSQLLVVLFV